MLCDLLPISFVKSRIQILEGPPVCLQGRLPSRGVEGRVTPHSARSLRGGQPLLLGAQGEVAPGAWGLAPGLANGRTNSRRLTKGFARPPKAQDVGFGRRILFSCGCVVFLVAQMSNPRTRDKPLRQTWVGEVLRS